MTDAQTAAPKKRKRTSPVRFVPRTCTFADISLSGLQELRDEVREIVDNAGDALANTQRIQTLAETADALDGVVDNEPTVPEAVQGLAITYAEQELRRRGRSLGRARRRDNEVAPLAAARDLAEELAEALRDPAGELPEGLEVAADARDELADELETLAQELGEIVDAAEGCEFPGMYG